jgi:hypothetical protein
MQLLAGQQEVAGKICELAPAVWTGSAGNTAATLLGCMHCCAAAAGENRSTVDDA